jgi:hypothetical protein
MVAVPIKWGAILGIAVGAMGFVFAGTGLHTNPAATSLVFVGLAIVINVAVVVVGLGATAGDSTWGRQVANAAVIGVVGAVLIFASSWLMTVVVFPDYYSEMFDGYRQGFANAGMSQDQIATEMGPIEASTPVSSALSGATGSVFTSLLVGALAGIRLRQK